MAKQRTYTKHALEASSLFGQQVKLGRKQRHWTEQNLADRAGISRATLQKIERGDMSCAIGLAFEVATLVGVKLFEPDGTPISKHLEHTRDKVALLPQRIKSKNKPVQDDF